MSTLRKEHLELMNSEQIAFVEQQWYLHQHDDHEVVFDVSGFGDVLITHRVMKGVWHPLASSGGRIARFLYHNNARLVDGRRILEVGTGTGLLAHVMLLAGAYIMVATDNSDVALKNATHNLRTFVDFMKVPRKSDLFEKVPEMFDTIVWNIPFFPGSPPSGDTISASMIMSPILLGRFLMEARDHLTDRGVVVVPSHSRGGPTMDPLPMGRALGYRCERTYARQSCTGVQTGTLYVTELRLP